MKFLNINRKTISFFLSVLISIFCLGGTLGCLPAYAALNCGDDSTTLDCWNDTPTKQAITDFVDQVITGVPVKDRIAVFDNDGTLWAERPHYFQEDFIKNRLPELPERKVSRLIKKTQKKINKTGGHPISEEGKTFLSEIPVVSGMTTGEYNSLARSFLDTIQSDITSNDEGGYQRFDTQYINLTYKPVIQLVNYLKENDFKVYICSGGGIYFVRSFSDEAYGIPSEEVIGSAIKTFYDESNTTDAPGGSLVRQLGLAHYDDQEGKPVGIELFIGKQPIIAVGNSSGDFEMFKYTDAGVGNSLIVLINHDDCEREYKYNDVPGSTHIDDDGLEVPDNESLDYAQNHENWIVASMKDDFNTIFDPIPARTPPVCN
ncbi:MULTISPECIES: HAD family phosphatase [unclassified Okeania]|uniref:HAD family hydrolase n=1 Tax=unclassified Okeania TaxID=2634635 RepID=UPI0013B65CDC|nr:MULTISPECIES: haloacid dehalogenase-like hydrolase [unclassified Okeania]NES74825.1 haloacid dehalogenase-like hydrolase [Okeania sp. SIO1H4]NET18974.1 haloacid dehalogenase-like hydrolase [Okeania sp. SIO1H5]NET94386.1 haloacid dehalogenase-like hydrolase [Okeania sp. SIO1H2]